MKTVLDGDSNYLVGDIPPRENAGIKFKITRKSIEEKIFQTKIINNKLSIKLERDITYSECKVHKSNKIYLRLFMPNKYLIDLFVPASELTTRQLSLLKLDDQQNLFKQNEIAALNSFKDININQRVDQKKLKITKKSPLNKCDNCLFFNKSICNYHKKLTSSDDTCVNFKKSNFVRIYYGGGCSPK